MSRAPAARRPHQATFASANVFDILGVVPALGRTIRREEDVGGGRRVAVLSHASWLRRFGGDPAIIGRTILFRGTATRIVGVLPPNVNFPESHLRDLAAPLTE